MGRRRRRERERERERRRERESGTREETERMVETKNVHCSFYYSTPGLVSSRKLHLAEMFTIVGSCIKYKNIIKQLVMR